MDVDVGVEGGVGRQALGGASARGDADDPRPATQVGEQRSAGIAIAGVGVGSRGTERRGEVPADVVRGVDAGVRATGGVRQAAAQQAGIVGAALREPEADDLGSRSQGGRPVVLIRAGGTPVVVDPRVITATSPLVPKS